MGEIVGEVDLTIVLLYTFWGFFFYLVYYLQKESRREGYPLESDETGRIEEAGVIFMPDPKTYLMPHGHGEVEKPDGKREERPLNLKPLRVWSGAPKEPTGNPMLDGVGPAAYAERADVPDLTAEGHVKIVPLRTAPDFALSAKSKSPIGYAAMGCDGAVGGTVTDLWVDLSERIIRFYEVQLEGDPEARVLVPMHFGIVRRWRGAQRRLYVHAITGPQFADVPRTKSDSEITLLEEDKIFGYFGGGLMYATEKRRKPSNVLLRYD
ncbi:MAG: photosynthetic reaction center subunit H [Pseudomonadota bacterium]